MAEKFEVGEFVQWQSQAQGSVKEKVGQIILIIPAGADPFDRRGLAAWKWMFDGGAPRDHESYLVEVPSKSDRGKPKLYWPKVKNLRRQQTDVG